MRLEDFIRALQRVKMLGLPVYVTYDSFSVVQPIERSQIVVVEPVPGAEGLLPGIYLCLESDQSIDIKLSEQQKAYRVP